jgi:SAM-dependent methyltransferase
MLRLAAARGLETAVAGVAEELPFPDASFDHALLVTTLCFVDSPERALAEAHRVLRSNGTLVIGFIDRQTPLGQAYLARRAESLFYRDATFYSALEVGALLEATGFGARVWGQTLVRSPSDPSDIEPLRRGTGRGGFAVVLAARTDVPADRGPRFG